MVDKDQVEHGKVHWQEMVWISTSGGVGGLLIWLWEIWRGTVDWSFAKLAHLPMYVAFGAGAAAVFILLIANSDRSDRARVVALALLAGFAWKPIWTSSQTMLTIQDTPAQKWSPDGPLGEGDPVEDGGSGDSPAQAYTELVSRLLGEPLAAEIEDAADLHLGERREIEGQSFRFDVDDEGPLIVEIEATDPDVDLVATLYQDSDGELQAVDIDDDSGDGFNPRIDLDQAATGSYVVVLRTFQSSGHHRGTTNVMASQP